MAANSGSLDLDENFYGDQDFDLEEFDQEGFDMGGGEGSAHRSRKKSSNIILNFSSGQITRITQI